MCLMYENDLVFRASQFALKKHKGQLDDNNQDYYDAHLEAVGSIIELVSDDPEVVAAALLHDTLEDTDTTPEELEREFGERVKDLVLEVTQEGQKDEVGYYFPRLHSQEAIMIKFADRLSNLSRMQTWSEERKAHYLKKSQFWKQNK